MSELTEGQANAYVYLSRLLTHYAPQCQPLPDLMGLCTQIDNLLVHLSSAAPSVAPDEDSLTRRQRERAMRHYDTCGLCGEGGWCDAGRRILDVTRGGHWERRFVGAISDWRRLSGIDEELPAFIQDAWRDSNEEFALAVLRNVGVDTECGACMEIAFTGVTTNQHDCKRGSETAGVRVDIDCGADRP
jgi:hypothetical protein